MGNYGFRKKDDAVRLFDLGDLTDDLASAQSFIRHLKEFNELLAEGLSEVDGVTIDKAIAQHYEKNPLRQDDFERKGKDLFGHTYGAAACAMKFPHTEEHMRALFASGNLRN